MRKAFFPSQIEERNAMAPQQAPFEGIPFTVYPNPTKDYLIITTEDLFFVKDAFIELCDLTGKHLYRQSLELGNNQVMLDVKKYPSGNYFVSFIADDELKHSQQISIQ